MSTSAPGRLRELDLLRFVAAFAVLGFHYLTADTVLWGGTRPTEIFPEVRNIALLGNLGVNLFFVISGFVILMSVWGRGPGEFAASRVVRLMPAYWLSVAVMFGIAQLKWLAPGWPRLDEAMPVRDYLTNLTMLNPLVDVEFAHAVYWTLWAELRFYLLIGILVCFGVTFRRTLAFMGIWLLLSQFAGDNGGQFLNQILMPTQAPYFIAGMAFYLIYRFGSTLIPWLFAGGTWILAMHYAVAEVKSDIHGLLPSPQIMVMAAITVIFALIALVSVGGLRWLRWKGLVALGALTYPLYLFHQPVAIGLIPGLRGVLPPVLVFTITTVAALVLSYLIYRLVETPVQRWMRPRLKASLRHIRALSATRRDHGIVRRADGDSGTEDSSREDSGVDKVGGNGERPKVP